MKNILCASKSMKIIKKYKKICIRKLLKTKYKKKLTFMVKKQ